MKLIFLLFISLFATAQTKKINFFGTEFVVNDNCIIKEFSLKFGKNGLIWLDAPPKLMRGLITSTIRNKIKGKKTKEVKDEDISLNLLKSKWTGKMVQYKKENNDTITNFVQLYGNYNNEDRLLIISYKTTKQESFRIPAGFEFLIK